ncbi:MAG TPA: COX15/CtaA family protein [Gammaproteobacteria bacterium]|nr:COX15/CtaA family protein [Gammaproteobacteria bacterium]
MRENLNTVLKITIAMTFTVIVLGAYTRLKDAGLGCPDWPGCYGQLFAPAVSDTFSHSAATKAWIEMIHRYVAGTLGLLILFLTIQSIRLRKQLAGMWQITVAVLALVVFQALLGMWTVTLALNPLVVMGHLLGGFAILTLVWWLYMRNIRAAYIDTHKPHIYLKFFSLVCMIALVMQIALGGWTSANFAAVVCADFPTCQGNIWPPMDWKNAFAIPGMPLENNARVTIQMAHRIGAMVITVMFSMLAFLLYKTKAKHLQRLGYILILLLGVQIILGITNVLGGLPLAVSLAHNAVAVLLLLCLTTIACFV